MNHCFCKTCWGDYFTNEIETLNRCNNIKCPFLMCENYANDDDIEGAVSEETFEKYKELKESSNSCLNKIFTQDTSNEHFNCPKCQT